MKIFWHAAVGPLECNCYLVGDPRTRDAMVIDPGGNPDAIIAAIAEHDLSIGAIVATHAHFDHIIAAERLGSITGAPFLLHRRDHVLLDWFEMSGRLFLGADLGPPPAVDTSIEEGDLVVAGEVELEVLHTPGHSPGSISLVGEDAVFSGDTLFASGVGRTDLPGGDSQRLVESIRAKLFALPEGLPVHPGHGPATTIETELRSNPFVGHGAAPWT